MKKCYMWTLVMFLSFLICPGIAEDLTLDLTKNAQYEVVQSICWKNNTLYILGNSGVYWWQEGAKQAETFYDLSKMKQFYFIEEAPKSEENIELWRQTVQHIFTDGTQLYGIQPYSGEILEITKQKMTVIAEIPQEVLYSENMVSYREIQQIAYAGNMLFVLLGTDDYEDYSKTELYAFNLGTNDIELVELGSVQNICTGAEGKLLILEGEQEVQLLEYDVASGECNTMEIVLEDGEWLCGLVWDPAEERYARLEQGVIETIDKNGVSVNKAYLPVTGESSTSPVACSSKGQYAFGSGKYVFIRDITGDDPASQLVLHVAGSLSPDLMIQFSIEHPDITVIETNEANAVQNAVLSSDSEIDLFVLSAPGDFAEIKEKGYISSIENGNLHAWARTLYSEIQDVIFNEEDLVAIPISIKVDSWTVDETMWKEFDLGEYPTTYAELFEKIALWLDSYANAYPDYTLSDIQQNGLAMLVSAVVKEYVFQNEQDDVQLTFDTDAFRSLMKDIVQNAELLSEEHEQWGMPILSSYSQGFGVSYNDSHRVSMFLPPTFDGESDQRLSADIEVLAIHAVSQKKEAAETFLNWYTENLSTTTRYQMSPEENDPVENPNYSIRFQELNTELAALKQQVKFKGDAERKGELEEAIIHKENQIKILAESKWSISEESIACYRSMAEKMRIAYQSAYFGSAGGFDSLSEVVMRFTGDGLEEPEIDAMIRELNRVAHMVGAEKR